ncbi:hypothetical protein ACLIBH_13195 [Virgibacillus sp. W0430]|uniref:hypothetical protein n=1 Tax=Virgibacillus sp. W0430 TaxID=3391580 RepID=UPI003F47AA50
MDDYRDEGMQDKMGEQDKRQSLTNYMYDQAEEKRNGSREEEIAAELTSDTFIKDEEDVQKDTNWSFGWISVVLSILSFFIIPIIFGAAGIILGFMARRRDAEILGNTAIVVGTLSIVIRLFLPIVSS